MLQTGRSIGNYVPMPELWKYHVKNPSMKVFSLYTAQKTIAAGPIRSSMVVFSTLNICHNKTGLLRETKWYCSDTHRSNTEVLRIRPADLRYVLLIAYKQKNAVCSANNLKSTYSSHMVYLVQMKRIFLINLFNLTYYPGLEPT